MTVEMSKLIDKQETCFFSNSSSKRSFVIHLLLGRFLEVAVENLMWAFTPGFLILAVRSQSRCCDALCRLITVWLQNIHARIAKLPNRGLHQNQLSSSSSFPSVSLTVSFVLVCRNTSAYQIVRAVASFGGRCSTLSRTTRQVTSRLTFRHVGKWRWTQ